MYPFLSNSTSRPIIAILAKTNQPNFILTKTNKERPNGHRRAPKFSSKADPDMWIRKVGKGAYDFIARFVDDVIAFSKKPMEIMKELKTSYIMKGVGKPQYYLGGDIVDLPPEWHKEGITSALSAKTYIQNCVPKLAKMCGKEMFKLQKAPFSESYHAELDDTPLCNAEKTSKYKSLIGSANWCITLG